MTRLRWLLVLAMASSLGAAPPALAGAGQYPRILLHLDSVTTKNACGRAELACCSDAVMRGTLNQPYFLYVLAAPSDSMWLKDSGIAGMQFGVDYVGGFNASGNPALSINVYGWTLCATLEFPSPYVWPGPGSGTIITWDVVTSCQRKPVAVAGYFYMNAYQPTNFRIVRRQIDGKAVLVSCDIVEHYVEHGPWHDAGTLAAADFNAGATYGGLNPCTGPCVTTAAIPATWSGIKAHTTP